MASPVFSDNILKAEVRRLSQQNSSFAKYISTEYQGEIQGKASIVFVPVMTNIVLTGVAIAGASGMTLGTWPGQSIAPSNTTLSLEPLTLSKYAPYLEKITDFQAKHSTVPLEIAIGKNLASAKDVLLDNYARDLILVDKIASIPAGNKINSGAPIAIATGTIVEAFGKSVIALDTNFASENRVCMVGATLKDAWLRSNLLTGTQTGIENFNKGYLGMYGSTPIVYSAALNASNAMIMMEVGSVNVVSEDYGTKSMEGTDGNFRNVFTEIVYGGNIFTTNLVKVSVSYFI